jgi:AcrR family transcriptional regulator
VGTVTGVEAAADAAPGANGSRDAAPPGPRRSGSRPLVRRAIVQAAAELFIERGYHEVTVAEIAEHVGIARRTFFLHFTSKDDPLLAWLDDEWRAATEVLLAQPAADPPLACYLAALRGLGSHFDQDREVTAAITRIVLTTPALFGKQYARQFAWAARWAAELRERHGRPATDALAYEVEAGAAFSVLAVAARHWIDDPERRPFRTWLDRGFARLRAIETDPGA